MGIMAQVRNWKLDQYKLVCQPNEMIKFHPTDTDIHLCESALITSVVKSFSSFLPLFSFLSQGKQVNWLRNWAAYFGVGSPLLTDRLSCVCVCTGAFTWMLLGGRWTIPGWDGRQLKNDYHDCGKMTTHPTVWLTRDPHMFNLPQPITRFSSSSCFCSFSSSISLHLLQR